MPVPQTSYTARIPVAYEGQVATEFDYEAETRLCETVAGIGFGRAVSQGVGDKGALLGGATKFTGVTIRDVSLVPILGQTVDLYQQRQNMNVLVSGDIWVKAVNGCVAGNAATYDATTGQFNPAAAGVAIPHSKWLTTATAGNLAKLRLFGQPGV